MQSSSARLQNRAREASNDQGGHKWRDVESLALNKRGGFHYDPHERISHVGGDSWKLSENDAIRTIENYTNSFYTLVNGKEADV